MGPLQTTLVSSQTLIANLTSTDLQNAGLIPVYVRSGDSNSNTGQFDLQPCAFGCARGECMPALSALIGWLAARMENGQTCYSGGASIG